MLRPRSIRHNRVPSILYASTYTLPVYPDCELSCEFDGSHLTTNSSTPSPSRSPTLVSLALYVYATPSGVVPPAGTCSGTSRYPLGNCNAAAESACSTPPTTARTV